MAGDVCTAEHAEIAQNNRSSCLGELGDLCGASVALLTPFQEATILYDVGE